MAEDSNAAATAKAAAQPVEVAAAEESKAATANEVKEEAEARTVTPAEPVPTIRQIFSLPGRDDEAGDVRWDAFQERVSHEIKSIKWTSSIPDLAPKVCELLDIKIPDVLIAAWKKVADIQAVIEKTKKTPDETVYLELAQHTINSEHRPSIEVKIKGAMVKKIELVIQLGFNLTGFLLKIQNGAITELQTGQCEAKGTIKYGGLSVAEKKLEPIKLPFAIPIPAEFFVQVPEVAAEQVEELERFEL